MNCEFSNIYLTYPTEKIKQYKLYYVFNGFAHKIPNSLLFGNGNGNGTHNYSNSEFSSEIDYVSIDSYIFGVYLRLYDGENNTVRFLYPDDDKFIVDVEKFTGYENRNGTKKEVPSREYLRDYEKKLIKKEKEINDSLIEIEEKKIY